MVGVFAPWMLANDTNWGSFFSGELLNIYQGTNAILLAIHSQSVTKSSCHLLYFKIFLGCTNFSLSPLAPSIFKPSLPSLWIANLPTSSLACLPIHLPCSSKSDPSKMQNWMHHSPVYGSQMALYLPYDKVQILGTNTSIFMYLFIHLFYKYVSSSYCVSGTTLGIEIEKRTGEIKSCPLGPYILVG